MICILYLSRQPWEFQVYTRVAIHLSWLLLSRPSGYIRQFFASRPERSKIQLWKKQKTKKHDKCSDEMWTCHNHFQQDDWCLCVGYNSRRVQKETQIIIERERERLCECGDRKEELGYYKLWNFVLNENCQINTIL